MLKDFDRYILTTDKASVMRDVLSLVSTAELKSEGAGTHGSCLSLDALAKDGYDRMILELRRPKEPAAGTSPKVRNLRTSHLGRVLVVTGDATAPEIFHEIDGLRRPRLFPRYLKSGLLAFGRTIFSTLRLANPQN